jgi:uncharacterized protein (DUF2132 family)
MTDDQPAEASTADERAGEEVPASAKPVVPRPQPNDPLHGVTLEAVMNALVAHYGWDELGRRIRINCFVSDPSVKSSLRFLRKTPWARKKVEDLYLATVREA